MSFKTTKEELSELLSAAGSIVDVHIPTDRETGRPRGFAFVRFSKEEEALEAIRRFNGFEFGGRRLNVNQAEDRPRGGGGGSGPPRRDGPPRERLERGGRGPEEGRSRAFADLPAPPPDPLSIPQDDFDYRRHSDMSDDDDSGGRSFRGKGSRRGLRARKRSL